MLNIYRASAGSGKTYRLTQDYIHLLFDPQRERAHRRILAVTFTNKATEEMKSRILKELFALSQGEKSIYRSGLAEKFNLNDEAINARAKKVLTSILHDFSSFSISTIDGFFQQVIRSFAREIGVHGGYNLELDSSTTLEQSVDHLFLDLSKVENKQLLQWLTEYAEERVEQSISWDMRQNIRDLGKEIFKESYQYKAEETNRKLHEKEFLTDYRKKLKEITTKFDENIKTCASEALKIIQYNGLILNDFKGGTNSSIKNLEKILTGEYKVSATFLSFADDVKNCYSKNTSIETVSSIENAYNNGLQRWLMQINTLMQSDFVYYNTAKIIVKNIHTLGILSDLAIQIKSLTDAQNSMLISDSNLLLNKIIDNSEMPFIYEKTGTYIDNFMIDEFQDTSVLQWKNFQPLISNSLAYNKFNLVVGDVKQSIYRWRNSDWKLLDEQLRDDFRTEQIQEEYLDTNWRSDKNIVEFNNSIFNEAARLLQLKLNGDLESVLPLFPSLEPLTHKIEHAYSFAAQHISQNAGTGYVQMSFIDKKNENEDDWKVDSLKQLPLLLENLQNQGYSPSDCCILVRYNHEVADITNYMLSFKTSDEAKTGYCYDMLGNQGLLINRAASVRFILGIMQLLMNPFDPIQLTIVNYEYARGRLHKSENEAINLCFAASNNKQEFSTLFSKAENSAILDFKYRSLYDLVEQIISVFEVGTWHNEAVFVQSFQDAVFKFTTGRNTDLNSFLNWWNLKSNDRFVSTPEQQNAFRIMTIHKSKGLDFEVVIMPFCDWELDKAKGRNTNFLWCQPSEFPFNQLPLLPAEYNNSLKDTIFSEQYFDEQMHRYIDNLNLAYVAFTRAKHELICICPDNENKNKKAKEFNKITSLSALLKNCFMENNSQPDKISLSQFYDPNNRVLTIGNPTQKINDTKRINDFEQKIVFYPSVNSSDRLFIRHQSTDFLITNQSVTNSKINFGIIMHDILRKINQKSDQSKAIQAMLREGRINESERKIIEAEMEKFWQIPGTESWFTNNCRILNETSILTPSGKQYRPDRIVIQQNEAIIIDYKFGEKENSIYFDQVRNYMNLISDMGYQTKGYVCYVNIGKIVEVNH